MCACMRVCIKNSQCYHDFLVINNFGLDPVVLLSVLLLGEMHGIVGRAWCYDRWMYTLTTDDLTCNNNNNY